MGGEPVNLGRLSLESMSGHMEWQQGFVWISPLQGGMEAEIAEAWLDKRWGVGRPWDVLEGGQRRHISHHGRCRRGQGGGGRQGFGGRRIHSPYPALGPGARNLLHSGEVLLGFIC